KNRGTFTMNKVLMACLVLVLIVQFATQVDSQNTTANSTTPKNGGFMVLNSIFSLVLPAGLLAFLLHDLRW
ncbi:hypothetical protein, partial [Salmonella sp. s58760]|uniref:hypothetical protein n=1 Tax=Salmonella sp. s58760 TaxID=3159708 RepID=UPI0039801790